MTASKSVHDVLHDIQVALKVPKDLWNDFGKYPYRNAESILQAVKPLLPDGYTVIVGVEPRVIGGRFVCMAEAMLAKGNDLSEKVWTSAYAVEPLDGKKGMDAAQVSGATISYAKKYALGNLFAIDGNKDSDAPETPSNATNGKNGKNTSKAAQKAAEADTQPLVLDVNKEQHDEAKRVLFRAMQGYAERTGRDVAEIVDATFAAKPADQWTVDELDMKASEFSGEAR